MVKQKALLGLTVAGVALACAARIVALPAGAQGDQGSAMYVCRPAAEGETGNARMMATPNTTLTCRPVKLMLRMSNGSMRTIGTVTSKTPNGPDLSKALTPAQIDDAWIRYIMATFHVERSP